MLCSLAVASLEQAAAELGSALQWQLVDVSKPEGIQWLRRIRPSLSRQPSVPSILINQRIAFDSIPGSEELVEAVKRELAGDPTEL